MKMFKNIIFVLLVHWINALNSACIPGTFQQVTGSPFATATGPFSVAFSPIVSGHLYAAVANFSSSSISVYAVDNTTGFFTPVSGSPFPTGGTLPTNIAFSPLVSGKLYAAVSNSGSNSISIFSVDLNTGIFSAVAGSPFAIGSTPEALAFSPQVNGGVFLGVSNLTINTLKIFSFNTGTGSITQVSSGSTGAVPISVAFSPLVSNNLYVATSNQGSANASVFSVNTSSGALTAVTGSPFATGSGPRGVAFSPFISNKLYAAVANEGANNISVYSVDPTTGIFTPITGSPFPAGDEPAWIAFSPFSVDLFAAAPNFIDATVSVYMVDPVTGSFSQVMNSPFSTGTNPINVAFSPITPTNNVFAAVTNETNASVSVYSVCFPIAPTPTPSIIQPPIGLSATTLRNIFLVQTDLINIITWQAPSSGLSPVSYKIYRDPALTQFVTTLSATSRLIVCDHNRQCGITYQYFIVSVDAAGNVSTPATISITT